MTTRVVRVGAKRTVFAHVYLHSAASHALDNARLCETGSFFEVIHCLVDCAFCIEAYLNYVGEQRVPNWATRERPLSPSKKLALVTSHLRMPPYKGTKLHHSFQRVFRFRNLIAHGRTETVYGSWIENEDVKGSRRRHQPECEWEKLCNIKTAKSILSDTEKLIRQIHEAAGWKRDPFEVLDHGMFVRPGREQSQ